MSQRTFLEQLGIELGEIGADFKIDREALRFAVWVGQMIFDEDPQELIEERILYDGSSTGGGLCVIRIGDNSESGANLVLCDFSYERDTSVDCDALRGPWDAALANPTLLTPTGQEFAQALVDDPATPVTHYVASVRTGTTCSFGKLFDVNQLEALYARNRDPNSVIEPDSLEIPAASMESRIHLPIGEPGDATGTEVHIVLLPLTVIHNWVSEHENGLFAENLRNRLADKSNKGARELDEDIRETVEREPERMLIQNNGLTITCRALEEQSDGRWILLKPQIVNGCQTSWAIHESVQTAHLKGSSPPQGFALAKIVVTDDPSIAHRITESSNRQNAILPRDEAARDPRQKEIAKALASFATNLRVHWDHRRGAIANIRKKDEAQEYLVMGSSSIYRILRNDLGGQVMLAMAGAVLDAKNKLADLFNPASALPRWAFAYDLPVVDRFTDLRTEPYLESGGSDALPRYVADLMFGFAVYQHAVGVFREGYAATLTLLTKRAKQEQLEPAALTAKKAPRAFVRYWAFDVVRLTHRVVEAWVERGRDREMVRRTLVGDLRRPRYMDALFQGKSARPQWFRMDQNPDHPNVLEPGNQPSELLLPRWFVEFEEIGAAVIDRARQRDPLASPRSLMLSSRTTGSDLASAVDVIVSDSRFELRFPLQQES